MAEREASDPALARAAGFPRLRYMGSKYRLLGALAAVFRELDGDVAGRRALDPFCGSGAVAYLLKSLGYQVTASDCLTFPAVIAGATIANDETTLDAEDVATLVGPAADDRDFIRRTFDGLYFTAEDREFLDSAWSHIDRLAGAKRELAISALILAAARKQPRGVFTVTDLRYDDGRRQLRLPLRDQFPEAVRDYNAVVFGNGTACRAAAADVGAADAAGQQVVYLDPPYAPPRDDNCYIKRYHFLEGLSVYWQGLEIMAGTKTKKLPKRPTPFASPRTVTQALAGTIERFRHSAIVMSYSSNAYPDAATIAALLREQKGDVEVRVIDHRYHFGTHARARRRQADEYLFVAR